MMRPPPSPMRSRARPPRRRRCSASSSTGRTASCGRRASRRRSVCQDPDSGGRAGRTSADGSDPAARPVSADAAHDTKGPVDVDGRGRREPQAVDCARTLYLIRSCRPLGLARTKRATSGYRRRASSVGGRQAGRDLGPRRLEGRLGPRGGADRLHWTGDRRARAHNPSRGQPSRRTVARCRTRDVSRRRACREVAIGASERWPGSARRFWQISARLPHCSRSWSSADGRSQTHFACSISPVHALEMSDADEDWSTGTYDVLPLTPTNDRASVPVYDADLPVPDTIRAVAHPAILDGTVRGRIPCGRS